MVQKSCARLRWCEVLFILTCDSNNNNIVKLSKLLMLRLKLKGWGAWGGKPAMLLLGSQILTKSCRLLHGTMLSERHIDSLLNLSNNTQTDCRLALLGKVRRNSRSQICFEGSRLPLWDSGACFLGVQICDLTCRNPTKAENNAPLNKLLRRYTCHRSLSQCRWLT